MMSWDTSNDFVIHTSRLTLKSLNEKDSGSVLEFYNRNKVFLSRWEPLRHDGFYTDAFQKLSLKLDRESQIKGDMFRFWIFLRGESEIIGTVSLSHIVRGVFKSCYLGYKISEENEGKGYMTEALKAVIDFAFGTLKLHRIEANIMPTNLRSIQLIKRLSFEYEGLSKKYLMIDGQWEDHMRFALLNDDI